MKFFSLYSDDKKENIFRALKTSSYLHNNETKINTILSNGLKESISAADLQQKVQEVFELSFWCLEAVSDKYQSPFYLKPTLIKVGKQFYWKAIGILYRLRQNIL